MFILTVSATLWSATTRNWTPQRGSGGPSYSTIAEGSYSKPECSFATMPTSTSLRAWVTLAATRSCFRICDPKLLKMEMDVFGTTYAGQNPLDYFQKYPGRFPLLHIKDFKPGFPTSTTSFPYDSGPN